MEIFGSNLFVLIGALVIGYVIGIIDSRLTAKMRQPKPKEPEIQIVEKVVEVERVVEAPSVLSVNFDGNRPIVKLDGVEIQYYDVSHAQRKRLIDVLTYIRPWIDARVAPPRPPDAAASQAPAPAAQPRPAAPAQAPRPATPLSPPPQRVTTPQPPAASPEPDKPKIEPVSMNVITSARYLMQNRNKEEPRLLTIVEQIDAVLQKRLPLSPYADMEISMKDAPGGGVLVIINGQKYQGVDSVPDPGIRDFIRDCVQRWEKS